MPDPTEAPGISYEKYSSIPELQPSEGRGLADMLLDSRETPQELPPGLAALMANLAEVIRGLTNGVVTAALPTPEPQADRGRAVQAEQSQ
jgi:hypothetical protein